MGSASTLVFPLLGTDVTVTISADSDALAEEAVDVAIAEIVRWQSIFSTFELDSELCRWRDGRLTEPGPELAEMLRLAAYWWRLSAGAFHPATGALREVWLDAVRTGVPPEPRVLGRLAARPLPYTIRGAHIARSGDCSGLDLNAIAKGGAVDAAVRVAAAMDGVTDVLVNAGGDLRRAGPGAVTVDVADPTDRRDDAVPLRTLRLTQGAVASSASALRGFQVGDTWHSHVLDPHTGRPADGLLQAAVMSSDATTADAVATAALVMAPLEASRFLTRVGVFGWLMLLDGSVVSVTPSAR
jgi:thiamine biosynthesis lipoprotein